MKRNPAMTNLGPKQWWFPAQQGPTRTRDAMSWESRTLCPLANKKMVEQIIARRRSQLNIAVLRW